MNTIYGLYKSIYSSNTLIISNTKKLTINTHYIDITSFSFAASTLSTVEIYLSVISCISFSESFDRSSLRPSFCSLLISSIASRLMFLIATLDCSASADDLFTSSFSSLQSMVVDKDGYFARHSADSYQCWQQ